MFDGDYPFVGQVFGAELSECHLAWLTHLCRCVPHAKNACLLLSNGSELETHCFPEPFISDQVIESLLANISDQPLQFAQLNENNTEATLIVCALPASHLAHIPTAATSVYTQGAVAMVFPRLEEAQITALSRLIRQNFDWHTLLLDYALQASRASLMHTNAGNEVPNVTNLLENTGAKECAQSLTNLLVKTFKCERVTACLVDGTKTSILAISGLNDPDVRLACNAASTQLLTELESFEDGLITAQLNPLSKPAFDTHAQTVGANDCIAVLPTARRTIHDRHKTMA